MYYQLHNLLISLICLFLLSACGGGGSGGDTGGDTVSCPTEPTSVNFASVAQNDGSLAPRELSVNNSCQATGTDSEGNTLDFLIANDGTFEFAYNPLINASALGEATVSGVIAVNGSVAYTVCSEFASERFCITYDGLNASVSP